MDERRKGRLKKYQQDLRTGLVVENILPAFRTSLTDVEYSRVREREDNVTRVDELIEILLTKENRHFEEFCTALEQNGYRHWAKKLQEEEEEGKLTFAGDVAIEVDDGESSLTGVTTVVRKGRNGSIELCFNAVTESFERGGELLVRFGKRVINMSQNALQAIKEGDNEEIKCIYQVKDALYHLGAVVQIAYTFLDKVAGIFYYLQSDSMAAAREGLSCSPPDFKPLRDLMGLLGDLSTEAEKIHSELVDDCKTARGGCREAVEVCACKERNSQNRKEAARVIGGTTAGVLMAGGTAAATGGVAAGGVAISAVAGVFTFGVGAIVGLGITAVVSTAVGVTGAAAGVGTAVVTHHAAKRYKESEATFRKIRGDFDALLGFAYDLKMGVTHVHTMQVNILTQVNNVKDSTDKENIVLIKDTLKHLNEVCTDNYHTISTCRGQLKSKMNELNAKLK